MARIKNIVIAGSGAKPIALDVFFDEHKEMRPTIIYVHGFNGFKDWGSFDLIAEQFLASGFTFIKFNFSHNGTSPIAPEDFVDLEAFAANNYTKQLHDLTQVIDWVVSPCNSYCQHIDKNKIGLIGHSMGGGICILKTAYDKRIKALVTWASVTACKTPWAKWPKEKMDEWKLTGRQHYVNSRTKQHMPLSYQLYDDYINHQDQLDILRAASDIDIPWLICHGTKDLTVPTREAFKLKETNPASNLFLVMSDHTFGKKHPWPDIHQPSPMQKVLNENIFFFKQHLT